MLILTSPTLPSSGHPCLLEIFKHFRITVKTCLLHLLQKNRNAISTWYHIYSVMFTYVHFSKIQRWTRKGEWNQDCRLSWHLLVWYYAPINFPSAKEPQVVGVKLAARLYRVRMSRCQSLQCNLPLTIQRSLSPYNAVEKDV